MTVRAQTTRISDISADPIYLDEVLLALYDVENGTEPSIDMRTLAFMDALWRLRANGLVEWGEDGRPARQLTDVGRGLATTLAARRLSGNG